jgi:Zn-dependent protease
LAAFTSAHGSFCSKCGYSLDSGALACGKCGRLVYADQLEQIANRARQLAALGQLPLAREHWAAALQLLPDSPERRGVQREIEKLDARMSPAAVPLRESRLKAAVAPLLAKLIFPVSLIAFVGVYWSLLGWWFAVGITASVLMHEMGHYITVRRFGFKAELPTFLPGFGAFVRWTGGYVDPTVRAIISLAGPLFGFLSGVLAYLVFRETGRQVWLAVAEFAGWLNLLNLTPVSIFDGGAAMTALGRQQRIAILIFSVIFFFLLHDYLFLILAGGCLYRLSTRDMPAEQPGQGIAVYFIVLAAANGLLSWYCSHQGYSLFSRL